MKIIPLVPSYTETLFALGLGPEVIGVTEHCDFPPEARDIEKVGTFAGPDVQKIMAMNPDLVCADPVLHKKYISQLLTAGIKVYSPWLQRVDDVLRSMEEIAQLCGQRRAVEEVVAPLRDRVNRIKRKTAGNFRPRVFRIMNDNPIITPGPYSVQYDAVRLAGGLLLSMKKKAYLKVSWEELVSFDPEVLLFCGRRKGEPKRPRCKGCLLKNPPCQRQVDEVITEKWSVITAVKNNRIFPLSCDVLCRPGVRLVDGIEKLYKYFMSSG